MPFAVGLRDYPSGVYAFRMQGSKDGRLLPQYWESKVPVGDATYYDVGVPVPVDPAQNGILQLVAVVP